MRYNISIEQNSIQLLKTIKERLETSTENKLQAIYFFYF